jgi:hypothetical protein
VAVAVVREVALAEPVVLAEGAAGGDQKVTYQESD